MKLHSNWRIWWRYLWPTRLTLITNPPIYRWLFWVWGMEPSRDERHLKNVIVDLEEHLTGALHGQQSLMDQTVRIRHAAFGDQEAHSGIYTEEIVHHVRSHLEELVDWCDREDFSDAWLEGLQKRIVKARKALGGEI